MKLYIVNTTFMVYMHELRETEVLKFAKTTNAVTEELGHLKNARPEIEEVKPARAKLLPDKNFPYLSEVDLELLETSKALNSVLVTDDQKLAKAASSNGIMVIDTPKFLSLIAFEGAISYEKAEDILINLKPIYNRLYSVNKSLRNLKEWR